MTQQIDGNRLTSDAITQILQRMESGDRDAADRLFEAVYGELRELAKRQRQRWYGDYTLDTTALVHEAYLKLVGQQKVGANSRAHFFALAARAMRHILSNYAKRRSAQKRGGGGAQLALDEVRPGALAVETVLTDERAQLLLALDAALRRLESISERQSRIVECRFYGGMSVPDTATALGVSPATVKRDWAVAQAWLYRELSPEAAT